ncbi:arginase family protein [Salinicola rhizosphaerae]|uniref:Agmatinase n=1 Tax=Salinicola rhizosphaerae TaxID=1443141 RepID=A0ABQ3E4D7_9GAMM|nr:arginase family protein [Salinicola rhizosphaerae]GHB25738.1 agmatinase [Salinicola rhizosphaerae]
MFDATKTNRAYCGIPTFLRADLCALGGEIPTDAMAVLGIPFDEASPFMPGARFAPRSLREHSLRFSPQSYYDMTSDRTYLTDAVTGRAIVDAGDVDVVPVNVAATHHNITEAVAVLLAADAIPVVLGGDHSISFPVVSAFQRPIHVIQIDAHLDFAPITDTLTYTNGQPFRHISNLPQVQSVTHIGARSLRIREAEYRDTLAAGNRIVGMDEIRETAIEDWLGHIPADASVYLSVDIDAFDMSLVPGCVSGEPDGLDYRQMRSLLKAIVARFDLVGFDLVEINPQLDVATGATSYLGAQVLVELMGYRLAKVRMSELAN